VVVFQIQHRAAQPLLNFDPFLALQKVTVVLLILVFGLLLSSTKAIAEQKQEFGRYEIHYMALPTTVLQPEIAKQFGLVRSKTSGFMNISVIENLADGTKKPVAAFIKGTIRNSVQQQRQLEFSRIYEGQSLYQIANFWYSQGEIMTFNLEIMADPNDKPITMKFSQALFPD